MEQRETLLRQWFAMWLQQEALSLSDLFAPDAVYIEGWGPEYRGAAAIRHWFQERNTRGRVLQWDIQQFFHKEDQTVVQWTFRNQMRNGRTEAFDGRTLVRWTPDGKIAFLQEFGCNQDRYNPYRDGPAPKSREGPANWF